MTPRQHAQRLDRFKFHRVIKYLREIEEKELNINRMLDEDETSNNQKNLTNNSGQENVFAKQFDFREYIVENKGTSFGISIILGIILFLTDKILLGGGSNTQQMDL
jgi:hypothetical protein